MSNQILLEDLAAGEGGFVVYGQDAGDAIGYPVAGAGDINGDGFADMVFGAYWADGGGNATSDSGEIYVVFGRPAGFPARIDGAEIAAGDGGFVIYGRDASDNAGYSVAGAGDINGDGFDDLVVSASRSAGQDNAEAYAGEVYVVFGRGEGFGEAVWLEDIAAGDGGFVIYGRDPGDVLGAWTVGAGDVNGDGVDDLLVNARGGDGPDNETTDAGEVYVIFGRSGGFASSLDLADIAAGNGGFVIYGSEAGDAGDWVGIGALGDINGDGLDDIGIGALGGDGLGNTRPQAGEVYIVFGRTEVFGASVNLSDVAAGNGGFVLHGRDPSDAAGYTVTAAGDINADGVDDFIITSRFADGASNTQPDAGEAYVVFGRAGGFPAAIDLEDIAAGSGGFVIYGRDAGDDFGNSAIGTGDINGDGIADVVISAWLADGEGNARPNGAEVYVIFGREGDFPARLDLADVAAGVGGLVIYSDELSPGGWIEVGALGDVNGDGFKDLGIGAMSGDGPDNSRTGAGEVYVLLGRPFGQVQPGTPGNDELAGGDGPDTLDGAEGNDTLSGGGGDDRLLGGAGADEARFAGERAGYTVVLNADGSLTVTDTAPADGNEGADTLLSIERVLFSDGELRSAESTGGDDEIDLSGPGGGTAAGGDGDDSFTVDDPADVPVELPGGGIDTVRASVNWTLGPNLENLELTSTAQRGVGNTERNLIRGNAANNTLDGASGVDTLEGGSGNDTYFVDDPDDVVIEITGTAEGDSTPGPSRVVWDAALGRWVEEPTSIGDVADALRSSASNFELPVGVESATLLDAAGCAGLEGNADANPITGNAQANLLSGAAGNDTLTGGAGNDVASFAGARSGYTVEKLADGRVRVTDTDPTNGDEGVDVLSGVEALRFADRVDGGLGKAVQRGTASANTLDLTAAGGQIGAGGAGNDIYKVNSTVDAAVELAGGGRDRVDASVNWVLWDNVEDLRLTGTKALSGWGNELGNRLEGNTAANALKGYAGDDTLFGGAGADRLEGGDGADVLRGGKGNDALVGGADADVFLFDALLAGNKDTIADFVSGTDRIQLDNEVFTTLGALGALAANRFVAGADLKTAQDADDRIIYDTATGTLYYDADGKGGSASAVAFAVLTGKPAISAGDLLIGD